MPVIKFIEFDGTEHEVDADDGMSIMEVAMKYDIPGVDADCGGGAGDCDGSRAGYAGRRGELSRTLLVGGE